MIYSDFVRCIERFNMLSDNDSVAIGFSGGADSVALLHLLCRLRVQMPLELIAVHVNHNIRGMEAKRDEEFARSVAEKLGVKFKPFSVNIPELASKMKIGEEEAGRIVRYEFFESLHTDKIAVAHNADDNLETMLFNIARGSSLRGLSGIRPMRDRVIRPLIKITREQIEAYCIQHNLSYVTDSTNLSDEYTRNKIRHFILPVLKDINTLAVSAASALSESAATDEEYLIGVARSEIGRGIDGERLATLNKAVASRIVRIILEEHGLEASRAMIELCLQAAGNQTSVQLAPETFFNARDGQVKIERAQEVASPFEVDAQLGLNLTPYGSFLLERLDKNKMGSESRDCCFDYDKVKGKMIFRSRKPGDVFHDPKRKNTKSVKKLFTESRIKKENKNAVPLLCDDCGVIWIKGFRVDARYSVDNSTQKIIKITQSDI